MKPAWLVIALLLSLGACKKWFHRECRDDASTTTGIIIRELSDQCTHHLNVENEEVILRKTQWDSMWANPKYPLSGDCVAPDVDFDTETVLIFHSGIGDGFIEVRKVERDENAKQYVYTITQIDCSNKRMRNMMLSSSDNVMVVPKLPDGWSVLFVTEKED